MRKNELVVVSEGKLSVGRVKKRRNSTKRVGRYRFSSDSNDFHPIASCYIGATTIQDLP